MEQYHFYAFEALGAWHISMSLRTIDEHQGHRDETLYRGQHVSIDEQDPLVRAVLLLSQVEHDLNQAIMGELDTLADRPAHH